MSLRRSARAPIAATGTGLTQNIVPSSSSSTNSARTERTPRSSNMKAASPQGSNARSSVDTNDIPDSTIRRTRSSNGEVKQESTDVVEEENDVDSEEEETRCVCGQLEYPGLPVMHGASANKELIDTSTTTEDTTGWFIQCDECQVWQHGGCVGILDEIESPEKYFCETCRPEMHQIAEDVNGRKHTRYLPPQQGETPERAARGGTRSVRERRTARIELETSTNKGRRATMNSRDSAYDEAEQLRRAIEESKRDSLSNSHTRKAKRDRSESEEATEENKRRKVVGSDSIIDHISSHVEQNSDEDSLGSDRQRSSRQTTTRNQRSRVSNDGNLPPRLERSSDPMDASRKKLSPSKGSIELDVSPHVMSRTNSAKGASSNFHSSKVVQLGPEGVRSHKRGRRPPARRGRLGRNQYSKDQDTNDRAVNRSPKGSNSPDGELVPATGLNLYDEEGISKPSKPRHMNPNRTTLNDMKRRVAGILEYISHTQVEMAATNSSRTAWQLTSSKPQSLSSTCNANSNAPTQHDTTNATDSTKSTASSPSTSSRLEVGSNGNSVDVRKMIEIGDEKFAHLNALEMMEVLTHGLMRWQTEFGKYGEK